MSERNFYFFLCFFRKLANLFDAFLLLNKKQEILNKICQFSLVISFLIN